MEVGWEKETGVNSSLKEVCAVDKQCSVLDREQGTLTSVSSQGCFQGQYLSGVGSLHYKGQAWVLGQGQVTLCVAMSTAGVANFITQWF